MQVHEIHMAAMGAAQLEAKCGEHWGGGFEDAFLKELKKRQAQVEYIRGRAANRSSRFRENY
jgi:hypothetical protein